MNQWKKQKKANKSMFLQLMNTWFMCTAVHQRQLSPLYLDQFNYVLNYFLKFGYIQDAF